MAGIEPASEEFNQGHTTSLVGYGFSPMVDAADSITHRPADTFSRRALVAAIGVAATALRFDDAHSRLPGDGNEVNVITRGDQSVSLC